MAHGACERSCTGPGLGFWVAATSPHAAPSHDRPGRLVTTRPWYRQCQLLLQRLAAAPGEPSLPLGRRTEVLTAEPGFMGVAAGRGVSMWPPCKERQKRVSWAMPARPTAVCISSGHVTSQSDTGCSGQLWRQGLGKDTAGDREPVFGHKALELLGERNRGRRAGSRADLGRDPLERKVSPWSLFEVQERKRRRGTNTCRPHQSLLGKQDNKYT